jgi:hypothetical protein
MQTCGTPPLVVAEKKATLLMLIFKDFSYDF